MILAQGAEAVIELKDGKVLKSRISKSYRCSELDDFLRLQRTKKEEKLIKKLASLKINVPQISHSDDKYTIIMDYIDGKKLKEFLLQNPNNCDYLIQVGKWIGKMHQNGIIHGDLTTSNILLDNKDNLFLIDFGLSFFSDKIEDMAVDLHLLKQAFDSTHYKHKDLFFSKFKEGYIKEKENFEHIFKRLELVESRGRNKH